VKPDANVPALVGLGALANARHDFAAARAEALRAIAADAYSADAYGVLADALTQLGMPAAATGAVQHMLDLRPGLAAYARASYDLEQHGRLDAAATLMRAALTAAVDRSDIAFCRYQLGELEWQAGDLAAADADYTAGAAADPDYLPLAEGRAKLAAARGDTATALRGYAALTARYPTPNYLIEYAELLRATGQPAPAADALDLAGAAQALFTANGGADDLGAATLAIAQDRYRDAVTFARREWSKRHFSDVADVLGWALHLTGQDREALGYARQAVSLGSVNARFHYHLGAIEAALGDDAAARRDLGAALSANPNFAPLDAPVAQALLTGLGAR
jgi:tetratricopeptide (TPR) repeat protein